MKKTNEEIREYAVNAMRNAIIAQSLNGVNHAITKDEAVKSGTTEERWNQWVMWVSDLRDACQHYAELQADRNTPEGGKLMKAAEGKVWAQWRSILKVGEEDLFHKNMFVRRSDAEKLTAFAGNITYVYVPGKGKVPAVTGKNNFRKMVETFLAARISGNAMLSDAQRDVITRFQAAVNNEKRNIELLDGKGEEIGLRKTLTIKEETYNATVEALKAAKLSEEQITAIAAPAKAAYDAVKKEVETAEKSVKNAQDTQKELKEQYEEITGLLDALEAPQEVKADTTVKGLTVEEVKNLTTK